MRSWANILGFSFLFTVIGLAFFYSQKEPIRIGFIGGLSGRVADLGTAGRNGATLAIEDLNRSGGIRGKMVRLISVDDRQSSEAAVEGLNSLLSDGAIAIIGPMTSAMAVELVPHANRAGTIMVSPTANTKDLAGIDDYFIRVISSTDYYADHLADYLCNQKGLSKISVIYDLKNKAFSESFYSDFAAALRKYGGDVPRATSYYSGPDISFFDLTQETVTPETEAILVLANALDTALICQQISKISPGLPVVGTGWSATEKLIAIGGKAVEGTYMQQFFNREDTSARYSAFSNAYLERFGEIPGFASVAGYDAASLVIEALKETPEDLSLKQTIIDRGSFEGIQQRIIIDHFGDASRTPYITTVRDGKFVVLQ